MRENRTSELVIRETEERVCPLVCVLPERQAFVAGGPYRENIHTRGIESIINMPAPVYMSMYIQILCTHHTPYTGSGRKGPERGCGGGRNAGESANSDR